MGRIDKMIAFCVLIIVMILVWASFDVLWQELRRPFFLRIFIGFTQMRPYKQKTRQTESLHYCCLLRMLCNQYLNRRCKERKATNTQTNDWIQLKQTSGVCCIGLLEKIAVY
jgi:hypothetical protein